MDFYTDWPDLVIDGLEWDEHPGGTSWSILVPVDTTLMPGLAPARAAMAELPILAHPDHYLHVTLRQLEGAGSADDATLDAIAAVIAATPAWTAEVRGMHAFPTAIWLDPDHDRRFATLIDTLLDTIGTLPEHPYRSRAITHLTIGYSQADVAAADVADALGPVIDLPIGTIEVREALLAELTLDRPYPAWTVRRRFPFGPAN